MKLILFSLLVTTKVAIAASETACSEFVQSTHEGFKKAHTSQACISEAKNGGAYAQYVLGMSYGFSGDIVKEASLYHQSAAQGFVSAFLALGHHYNREPNIDIDQSVFWYSQYISSKGPAYGYAAMKIYRLMLDHYNEEAAEAWLQVCKDSPNPEICHEKR